MARAPGGSTKRVRRSSTAAWTWTSRAPRARTRCQSAGSGSPEEAAQAPAAYVRTDNLRIERLEQSYRRLADDGDRARYAYASPAFSYDAVLVYDRSGLVVDYPDIAVRAI